MLSFAALADPTRRHIVEMLARGPLSVGEIAGRFTISPSAVSQHLKVLLQAGLVVQRREGSRCIYQVDPRGVQAMRDYLDRFWDRALAAFKQAAEQEDS